MNYYEINSKKLITWNFRHSKQKETTMTTTNTPKKTPDYYVHATVPNGRGNRIGSRIGAIFNHNKGDGFTILLDAQPIPSEGQIELVAYRPKS